MNRQIRRLGIAIVVLFLALFVQLNYLQVFAADRLNNHPGNSRAAVRDFSRPRGAIQTADGALVAQSTPVNDAFKRQRSYPQGPLFAHVTGFFSFTFGSEGVERTYNDPLTGRHDTLELRRIGDMLLQKSRADNITLTISGSLQKVATDALGSRKGAVVALDPRSGAVLAMADFPSYDPNPLAAHDQKVVRRAWDSLNANPDKPLLPRAYRERYFPGSSFKVVTTATALLNGATTSDPSFPELTELPLPQSTQPLRNFGGESCGGPLPEVLRVSCNTAFAQLGLDLGAAKMSDGASRFGFGKAPPLDLPAPAPSLFPPASAFAHDKPALAKSAIGQQDVSATPLQMALVAAAIGNNGVAMVPHVMAEVSDVEGEVVDRFNARPWLRAVPADVARTTRDMMVGVVESGTGTKAQLPGTTVAGKTGTAQTGRNTSHTWFIAFAPAEAPRVAVAVIVENQPSGNEATGGAIAAPIARAVMAAALGTPNS